MLPSSFFIIIKHIFEEFNLVFVCSCVGLVVRAFCIDINGGGVIMSQIQGFRGG